MGDFMIISLYEQCIHSLITNPKLEGDLNQLPFNVAFDVCHTLFLHDDMDRLEPLLFANFDKFLKLPNGRVKLMRLFQLLQENSKMADSEFVKKLTKQFIQSVDQVLNEPSTEDAKLAVLRYGSRLGIFLSDVAWYQEAHNVLATSQRLCSSLPDTKKRTLLLLEFYQHLIRVQAAYSFLEAANESYQKIQELIAELKNSEKMPNLAAVYTNIAYYFFQMNNFQLSFEFSVKALRHLKTNLPAHIVLDTLRQASKSCVAKRFFNPARILIEQAVDLAENAFGKEHPRYADAQIDYGFFLLNHDSIGQCIPAYETAMKIKKDVFLQYNIHVGMVLEDFAYALYVYEYSSGVFDRALKLAKCAIDVMQMILPHEHIMLSSAQRVKALILEEIAIDNSSNSQPLLEEAETLHLRALRLSRQHFGEMNVLTAKHYGNLGRLYQTMRKFDKAEEMHRKAIKIKEEILGPHDYEVGLSLGHLASLYNYHMEQYNKAITLYLRSIDINLRLFGPEYSGLEYDYRGLVHVYNNLHQEQRAAYYNSVLIDWRLQRERRTRKPHVDSSCDNSSLTNVVKVVLGQLEDLSTTISPH